MQHRPDNPSRTPVLGRDAARQGVRGHGVWIVLVSSLFLALIAWGLLEFFAR
jgi:hypothetical protein